MRNKGIGYETAQLHLYRLLLKTGENKYSNQMEIFRAPRSFLGQSGQF